MTAPDPVPASARSRGRRVLAGLAWSLGGLAVVLGLALAALTWGPNLARDRIAQRIGAVLGRDVAVERIEVSPFAGRLVVDGLRIASSEAGDPMFAARRLAAEIDPWPYLRGQVVVRGIRLEAPSIRVVRLGPDRFDFTGLVERLAARPASDRRTDWRLDRMSIVDGTVVLEDRVVARTPRIEALQVDVGVVGNHGDAIDTPTAFTASLTLDGRPIRIEGQATPFAAAPGAQVHATLDALPLASVLPYLTLPPDVRPSAGALGVDLAVRWERDADPARQVEVSGSVKLDGLSVRDAAGRERLGARSLTVRLAPSQPLGGVIHVARIDLRSPRIALARTAAGHLDWPAQASASPTRSARAPASAPAAPASTSSPAPGSPSSPSSAARPKALRVDAVAVDAARIDWRDDGFPAPLELRLEPVTLTLRDLAIPDLAAPTRVTAQGRVDATIDGATTLNAELRLDGSRGQSSLRLAGVDLPRYAPLAGPALTAGVETGRLDAGATISWDTATTGWSVTDGALELKGLKLVKGTREPALLERLVVGGVSVDPSARRIQVASLKLSDGYLRARTRRDGSLDLADWYTPGGETLTPRRTGAPKASPASGEATPTPAPSTPAPSTPAPSTPAPSTPAPTTAAPTTAAPTTAAPTTAAPGPAVPNAPSAAPSAAPATPPWSAAIAQVELERFRFDYHDRRIGRERKPPSFLLNGRATDVTLDPSRPIAFEASASLEDGSAMSARGTVRPKPLDLDAQIRVTQLSVPQFDPYLAPFVNVSLASGRLWSAGRLQVRSGADGAVERLGFQGEFSANEFRAIDQASSEDFVRWGALAIPSVSVDWRVGRPGDSTIEVGDVAFVDFYTRLILSPEGRLNLSKVLRDPGDAGAGRSLTAAQPPASSPGAADRRARSGADDAGSARLEESVTYGTTTGAPREPENRRTATITRAARGPSPTVRVGTVRIAGGNVNFTDLFIRPNYSANLTQLNGSIEAIASDRPTPSDVLVTGRVDGDTPLEITGKISPLAPRSFVDLRAVARGFELPKLSPYSGRWAGYAIRKGRLTADVRYQIVGDELKAENRLTINQLTFGDKVDSPDATSLPVRFAVSLLKDSQGNIDLDLPISGTLSDPQFSVGGLLWRALGNVIARVVASPFKLLASLAGGGDITGTELSRIEFAPGAATLDDEDRGRLDALARALDARPELTLEIGGVADPQADRDAMQQERLEQLLKSTKLAQMRRVNRTAQLPALEQVTIDAAERPRLLEQAWRDAKLDAPGAAVPPPDELERTLVAAAPIATEEIKQIAQRRAQAAHDYLRDVGRIGDERIYLLAPRVAAADDTKPPRRVEFTVE